MQEVGAKCRGTVSALVGTEWAEPAATLARDLPEPVGGGGRGGEELEHSVNATLLRREVQS